MACFRSVDVMNNSYIKITLVVSAAMLNSSGDAGSVSEIASDDFI